MGRLFWVMPCTCRDWSCRDCHPLIPRDRPEWPHVPLKPTQ